MNLTAGVRVGPYEILAPLGAGGMGEVYRARDERLGRDIALKILSPDLSESGDHLRRFEQEARAASALNHPNIITIYDIGRVGGVAYIAMELIEGRDVRSMLSGEPLPLKQTIRIAVKVADGLAAAHERGILHRDLKPENLMVSRDGFVKILDFGLAKLVRPFTDRDTTVPHTTPGAVFGTVGYMSPEQAAGREMDLHSDQFSFGVILYEMLTGRMPFTENSAAETLAAIIRTDPPPIAHFNDKVPPELVRVVMRLLAKEPHERYASTRDLARDLRELRDRISNSSEPRHTSGPSIVRRTSTLRAIAAGAVAVAVIGGVAVMATRDRAGAPATLSQTSASKSVVVLPFRDLTGTAEGQIYSDGLAEMISSRLLQANGVRVIPRLSASSRSADPVAVARQLGAAFALRAAVQRRGSDVNVNYALLEAGTGQQVAGETVAAAAGDIFTLLDRLSTSILAAFNTPVPARTSALAGELTRSEDREAYVQALGLLQRSTDERSVDKAVETLERLLLNARDSAMINVQLARALIYKSQLGRRPALLEQANVYAERARDLDETVPEVHVRLGHIRFLSGKHNEAVREYQRALELRPDDPVALLGMAEVNEAMGRAADAEALYRKVIEARPEHADSYNRFGLYLLSRGRLKEAEKSLERFTQLAPDAARAFLNVGAAYQAQGRYEEARKAYEQSVRLNASGAALSNLATIEFHLGRYDRAAAGFERASRLSPTNHIIWINLGDAYRWAPDSREKSIGAFEKAIVLAREALAVNPRDAMTQALLATALAKSGNLAEGSAVMDAALKLDPTNPIVLYNKALVAQLRGTPATAITWLERAVRAGYPVDYLQSDPEFASVRNDPSFPRATNPGRG